jgi:ribonucleoside-diphosphate reductase beta chain
MKSAEETVMFNWDDPLGQQAAAGSGRAGNALIADTRGAVCADGREPAAQTGSSQHAAAVTPVRAEDKRVVNGQADINQLAPFRYAWAWKYFLNANKNHWTPLDINMAQDIQDYHHKLTPAERHAYENVLAYLTTSDILAMRNIGLAVMEKMSAPELQIYQARQVYEEALHTWTYQHCIETIGLEQGEIYNRYRVVPEIRHKIDIANRRLNSILRPDIDLRRPEELDNFVMAYIFFGAVFEGCWFYNGFSPIFALQRRGLMKGSAEQLQYIMRDEVMHCSFGIRTVKQIITENSLTLDARAQGIYCVIPCSAIRPTTTSRSSAISPTAAPVSSVWTSPFRAPPVGSPGWTNRPISARRRISSKPG